MDKAYRYTARNSYDVNADGLIVAPDEDQAHEMLLRAGLRPIELKLNLDYTVAVMTSKGFDKRELARVYRSLGRRVRAGINVIDGMERLAAFTEDIRLKTALQLAASAMRDGMPMGEATVTAGFPERDAMAISAMEQSGKVDEVLESLAEDVGRASVLQKSISRITFTPIMFTFIAWALFYGASVYLIPKTLSRVVEIIGKNKLPAYSQAVYDFTIWASANWLIYTVFYVGITTVIVAFFRWRLVKQWFLTHIGILDSLSKFVDHARLWRSYALLYEAGTNPAEAAELIGKSAIRQDSREGFAHLATRLRSGMDLEESTAATDFPEFVKASVVTAASQHGNIPEFLIRFSDELYEDVDTLTAKLKDRVSLLMTLFMAVVLMLFFLLTYYPMLSAVLSQM